MMTDEINFRDMRLDKDSVPRLVQHIEWKERRGHYLVTFFTGARLPFTPEWMKVNTLLRDSDAAYAQVEATLEKWLEEGRLGGHLHTPITNLVRRTL